MKNTFFVLTENGEGSFRNDADHSDIPVVLGCNQSC